MWLKFGKSSWQLEIVEHREFLDLCAYYSRALNIPSCCGTHGIDILPYLVAPQVMFPGFNNFCLYYWNDVAYRFQVGDRGQHRAVK